MDQTTATMVFRGRNIHVDCTNPQRADFWKRMTSGEWESSTFDVFDRYITKGTIALDIGAWIGATTLYMSTQANRVIALEPDPAAYRELETNIALNEFAFNVETHPVCISKSCGTLRLNVATIPGDSMSSVVGQSCGQGWDVKAVSLQQLLEPLPAEAPLFLKVDIEGFEYIVIESLLLALKGRSFVMFLSTHPEFAIGMKSVKSSVAKFRRKLYMAIVNLKLAHKLNGYTVEDSDGKPVRLPFAALNIFGTSSFTKDRTIVISSKKPNART